MEHRTSSKRSEPEGSSSLRMEHIRGSEAENNLSSQSDHTFRRFETETIIEPEPYDIDPDPDIELDRVENIEGACEIKIESDADEEPYQYLLSDSCIDGIDPVSCTRFCSFVTF